MNNQLATRSTFVYRQGRIVLFRALRKNPVLVLVQAFFIGTLLTALPLSSHGDQDPLINVNRAVHGFNAAMDKVLLRPLASTYKAVTPRFAIRRVVIDALFNPLQQLENHHRRTVLAGSEVTSDRERLG